MTKVYKFGGASVKDAKSVQNVVKIIKQAGDEPLIVVVSAMGKMTNALEAVHADWYAGRDWNQSLSVFIQFHKEIAAQLFDSEHPVFEKINVFERLLTAVLESGTPKNFSQSYDKVICYGEYLSTELVEASCKAAGVNSAWLDVATVIKTDSKFQFAKVDWDLSQKESSRLFSNGEQVVITQGFIGSDKFGQPTSLGREGSDFSAAILANLTDAESVTIWKDVPGMLNADPRYFENTVKLDAISYREAIELSYYGASVIHPKTIKPLQNKDIPLYIKSFYNPEEPGTVIQASTAYDHKVPSYIFKQNQTLVSVRPKDFSFMEEHQIEDVFNALTKASINCNLIQNSALSFSVVFDHHETKLKEFMAFLGEKYNVKYNTDLKLLNVRYYNQETIDSLTKNYEVLNTQQNRINCRMVLKDRQGL